MDKTIAGYRKSIQNNLKAERNLKKVHKELGVPWTKDLHETGLGTRQVLRVFVKVLTNIRNEMKRAAK